MFLQDDNTFYFQISHEMCLTHLLKKKEEEKKIKRRNAIVRCVTQNNKL